VVRVYEDPQSRSRRGCRCSFAISIAVPGDGFESLGGAARERIIRRPRGGSGRAALPRRDPAHPGPRSTPRSGDDAHGCAAIDWPGAGALPAHAEITYADPENYFGRSLSADGNPA
jgi:hypothetical protein